MSNTANYDLARRNMVESQVRSNDVTDVRIQEAMDRIPRERFVPKSKQALAYSDTCVDVAANRILLDPRSFAKLIHAAQIQNDDVVLDIACGFGYSTAILAALGSAVVALEADGDLVDQATALLTDQGIDNAAVVKADLASGYPSQGPYDVIVINGGVEDLPDALFDQLADGGRLVCIYGDGADGHGRVYTKSLEQAGNTIGYVDVFDAQAPRLSAFCKPEAFVF